MKVAAAIFIDFPLKELVTLMRNKVATAKNGAGRGAISLRTLMEKGCPAVFIVMSKKYVEDTFYDGTGQREVCDSSVNSLNNYMIIDLQWKVD